MFLLAVLDLQKDLGGVKKYTQVLWQAGQSCLWHCGKGLEAMKEIALFFCSSPPAFKLQSAISGCNSTEVLLLLPVNYNISNIWLQRP